MRIRFIALVALAVVVAAACSRADLETGSNLLQDKEPIDQISMYLVGFHPMKDDPDHAMEAHHYCHQLTPDLTQCVLFDGNDRGAKMNGIEYIISERVYETLPRDERKYWHPHNGEVLMGQLVMPGVSEAVEHETMKSLVNTYGKTWHLWNTGGPGTAPDQIPVGPPKLAWSYSAENEAPPELVADRDRRLGIDSAEKRRSRQDLRPMLHCQEGVDELASAFPRRKPLEGVCAKPYREPRAPAR
jgi:hypothetical protein